MRKRFKNKKRSCGLCKPHKKGWHNRWSPKEEAHLKEFELFNEREFEEHDQYEKDFEDYGWV